MRDLGSVARRQPARFATWAGARTGPRSRSCAQGLSQVHRHVSRRAVSRESPRGCESRAELGRVTSGRAEISSSTRWRFRSVASSAWRRSVFSCIRSTFAKRSRMTGLFSGGSSAGRTVQTTRRMHSQHPSPHRWEATWMNLRRLFRCGRYWRCRISACSFSLSAALTGAGSSPAVSFFLSSRCSADTPMSRIALTTLPRTGE